MNDLKIRSVLGTADINLGKRRTFQYNLYASCSFEISNAPPCRISLRLLVPVDGSSNEMSIMSGRYMHDISISSTRPVAWICACSRCDGPPNIIIARASLHTNSCRWMISATCLVICAANEQMRRHRDNGRLAYVDLCLLTTTLPFLLLLEPLPVLLTEPLIRVAEGAPGSARSWCGGATEGRLRQVFQDMCPLLSATAFARCWWRTINRSCRGGCRS
jgi:hypothetical protein